MQTYLHAYINTYTYKRTYTHARARTHTHTHTHTHAQQGGHKTSLTSLYQLAQVACNSVFWHMLGTDCVS